MKSSPNKLRARIRDFCKTRIAGNGMLMPLPQGAACLSVATRLATLTVMVCLLLSGCAISTRSTDIGSGTVYARGEHSRPHAAGYGRVWMEALRALRVLDWEVVGMEEDGQGGTITARRTDDTVVRLQLNSTGSETTLVTVRVGASGDWEASENLQTKISRGLRDEVEVGTGFLVRPDGVLVTAWHLLEAGGAVTVTCPNHGPQLARAQEISRSHDLAILHVSLADLPYLSLVEANSVRVGDPVFTIGFPVADLLGLDPKFTDGAISALSGIHGNSTLMQITVPIQPGNSGGPVLTADGEVVGMVVSSAAVRSFLSVTGTLPQNLNWAVKADYAKPLFDLPPAQPPASTRRAAIDRALQATCLIEVRR